MSESFRFHTRLHLSELTGFRARTLRELLELVKTVPGSSIYHHTHRFLQQHQYLSPEPPNDFAYWVTEGLGENELGEELASIDTVRFETIRALRDEIAATVKNYIQRYPESEKRFARDDDEFHFIKSVSFILETPYVVNNLEEFADALRHVTLDSIYFHIFEARLRLEKGTNDFSNWIEHSLNEPVLARAIDQLDPYTYTMDRLRETLIRIVEAHTGGRHAADR